MSRSPMHTRSILAAVLLTAPFVMGGSCLDPCSQLAQKICSCLPTAAEQASCNQEATIQQNARSNTLQATDRTYCTQKLSECECRALKEGNLAACGLARE